MTKFTHKDIPGWFDFENFYTKMVSEANNKAKFVEIGAWFGKSTCFLAQQIKESGKNISLKVVDTWEGSIDEPTLAKVVEEHGGSIYKAFQSNMEKAEVDKIITPLINTSIEASKQFKDKSLDFIFIDASHDYDSVIEDIKAWLPKLKKGGTIAGHDWCTYGSVQNAVKDSFKEFEVMGNVWYLKP